MEQVPILGPTVLPATVAGALVVLALMWWRRGLVLRPRTRIVLVVAALVTPALAHFVIDLAWRPFPTSVGWATD